MRDILEFLSDPHQDFPVELSTRVEGLLGIVRPLVASSEPDVVFSSLARLCAPVFSDGCGVEVHSDGQVFRIRYPRGRTHRFRDGVRMVNRFEIEGEFAAVVRVPLARRHGAFGPMYDGEMVFVWKDYQPGRGDQGLAELLVDRAHHIIEQQRIEEALAEARSTTERMRAAIMTGREIETALDKLRATHIADQAGYDMLRRIGEESAQLLDRLAHGSDPDVPEEMFGQAT